MSQFWKPTADFGELSTSLPSSRFLNDFEELKSIGKGKSLYLLFLWFLHLVIKIVLQGGAIGVKSLLIPKA
jgi:hypothetical protein